MTKILTALTLALALGLSIASVSASDVDPIRQGTPDWPIDTSIKTPGK